MVGTIFLILIFSVFWWYLVEYIKYFNTVTQMRPISIIGNFLMISGQTKKGL